MNDLTLIIKQFGDLSRYQTCPDFWVPRPRQAQKVIDGLKQVTQRTFGTSAGGRSILALEYGEKEPLDDTTNNLHACMASKLVPPDPTDIFPPAFYGSKRRKKPVLLIQGGIHGGELTGTVAAINLCVIIETGADLRGKRWPRLQELALQTRLIIVPWLNIDGVERWPLDNPSSAPSELYAICTHGVKKDGTPYRYPAHKAICPIPPDETAFMGTYFNDRGYNLQYDFCAVERQPETTAWMRYYLTEKPDAALVWHCNAGSLMGPPEFYLPIGFQIEHSRLAGAVFRRLAQENLNPGRVSWSSLPGMGKPVLEQSTAIYHTCGAMPLMCELPYGCVPFFMTPEQMLDGGLIVIEETLEFAHTEGLRPYEYWSKVKKSQEKTS